MPARNQPRSSRGRSAIARKAMNTNSTNGMMYQGTCIAHDGTKITPCRNFGGMKKVGAHPSATGFMRSRPYKMSVPAKNKNYVFNIQNFKKPSIESDKIGQVSVDQIKDLFTKKNITTMQILSDRVGGGVPGLSKPTTIWEGYQLDDFWTTLDVVTKLDTTHLYLGETAIEGAIIVSAMLANFMWESANFNICDESNWGPSDGPLRSCGQFGNIYTSDKYNCINNSGTCPACEVDKNMSINAANNNNNTGWAKGPQMRCGPDIYGGVKEQNNDSTHHDDSIDCSFGSCNGINGVSGCIIKTETGSFCCTDGNGNDGTGCNDANNICNISGNRVLCGRDISLCSPSTYGPVAGCCWWGRGPTQLTGPHNIMMFKNWLTDNSGILGTVDDLCKNPGLICEPDTKTTNNFSLVWLSSLSYWITAVQSAKEFYSQFTLYISNLQNGKLPLQNTINLEKDNPASWPSGVGSQISLGTWSNEASQHTDRICGFIRMLKLLGLMDESTNPPLPLLKGDCSNCDGHDQLCCKDQLSSGAASVCLNTTATYCSDIPPSPSAQVAPICNINSDMSLADIQQ